MRFTPSTVLALMAMAAPVLAQTADFDAVNAPAPEQVLVAGSVFDVKWETSAKYANTVVNLKLIGGPSQGAQQVLGTIATAVPNSAGHYSWTIDPIQAGLNYYGIIIESATDSGIFQYSNPFHISAAASQASSSSSAVAAPSATKTVTLSSATAVPSSSAAAVSTGAAQSETLIVIDVTTTVPCETTVPTAAAASSAVVVPVPAAESSPAASVVPSPVTPAPAGPTAASTGISPPSTFTSAVWTSPASPPAPTGGIPTTSGAGRLGGSLAVIGGLIAAFLAL